MNFRIVRLIISVCAIAALIIPMRLNGQSEKGKYHHYKLIDIGTFGGPQSYLNGFEYHGAVQTLNNAGTLTGWADTSMLDPNCLLGNAFGNFCFNFDQPSSCFGAIGCPGFVSHAFQWRDGVKTDLGALPGGLNSATAWISANGLIAGTSQNGETDPLDPGFPEDQAVLWKNGNIINLGTLPEGGYESGAQAVNSRGQVVGWALNTVSDPNSMALLSSLFNFYEPIYPFQTRAFFWQNGVMKDLGTLGTGTDAYAMAINEEGQVIGISYTNSTPNGVTTSCSTAPIPTQDPFFWENGKMIDLGTLGGTCGLPAWINNFGQVVGSSDLAGDQNAHTFLWTKQKGMQDLGTLGGSSSGPSMINDFGEVVGESLLPGDNQGDAFLWKNGTMHDLGSLQGCAAALAINARSQVVGNWGDFPNCDAGAFLWENGGTIVDLSTLISPPTDLSVSVISINDRGEIAGNADNASDIGHAVLLIPCDENHPGIEGCDYSLVDATTPAEVHPAEISQGTATASSETKLFPLGMTSQFPALRGSFGRRGSAVHFSVSAPVTTTIGSAFSLTVTALNSSNDVVTSYSGTVHFTSSDGQAVLPANSTLTKGVGNFSATLKTAGAQTITATDTVKPSITGTSSAITVSASSSSLTITSGAPPNGIVGLDYSGSRKVCRLMQCLFIDGFHLMASGGVSPYTWSWAAATGSSLPPGLVLSTAGFIGGQPTAAGAYNVVVTVTDSEAPAASVSASYTINVMATPSQVKVTISASHGSARPPIEPPKPVTLTWSSTDATSCTASASPNASDWSGPRLTSGSAIVSPPPVGTAIIYTLLCTGPTGSTSASVTVSTPCVVGPCRAGL
jgi:probable HAF family extracellular repeat protein